jgi:L-asparagine oxygenase
MVEGRGLLSYCKPTTILVSGGIKVAPLHPSASLNADKRQTLEKFGFVCGVQPLSEGDVMSLASDLGQIYTPDSLPTIQELKPRKADSESPNTYSGNFGFEKFPFHTDMANWHVPPRYLLLRCLVPDPKVVTSIVRAGFVEDAVGGSTLRRAKFMPRRPVSGRVFHVKLLEGDCFRWDPLFIEPVNARSEEVREKISNLPLGDASEEVILQNAGQWILLDNWRVLHSRSPVPLGSNRVIQRVFLSALK